MSTDDPSFINREVFDETRYTPEVRQIMDEHDQRNTTPPMPATQEEWETHWAFYLLTVKQRDAAWSEVRHLREMLEILGRRMHFDNEAPRTLAEEADIPPEVVESMLAAPQSADVIRSRRNVGIVGAPDAGKSTLVERMEHDAHRR
jgi:predicted GTPase